MIKYVTIWYQQLPKTNVYHIHIIFYSQQENKSSNAKSPEPDS